MSQPIRHTLPPELESDLFGSPVNGGCSSLSEICNGTSVLNDGIVPALSGVSDEPTSQWAKELFTMRRQGTDRIVVSFEVPIGVHNCMELTVFNCPERGIYAPQVTVYVTDALRIVGPQDAAGLSMIADEALPNISCEYLLKFCLPFRTSTGNPYLNLVFPYQSNSDFVFLGEITFLNDLDNPQCGPPKLLNVAIPVIPQASTTGKFITIYLQIQN